MEKRFYSEEEIIDIWKKKLPILREEETFNIYVDNPFCINQCLYCKHTGSEYKEYFKECKEYYEKLLPSQIKKFNHLFKIRKPDTIYFGGGSSSIMSAQTMRDIFDTIDGFREIPNKVFEALPNLMNDEKIDILIKNKFSYVSFGIQTFEKRVLEYNNRQGYNNIPLKKYISDLEKGGVRVNCDLMVFIGEDNYDLREIKRVKKDFIKLINDYNTSFITIYPETSFLRENRKKGVELSKELRKMILRLEKKYNLGHHDKHLSLDEKDIERGMEVCYHLTTTSSQEINRVKKYDSTGPGGEISKNETQNVLSFGGFRHHQPYSYHGKDFLYYNINDDNKKINYFGIKTKPKKMEFTNMDFI